MSDPTLDAIGAVRTQVAELRADLTGRMDAMVTQREHDAEIRRIDAEAARTRDALTRHEDESSARNLALVEALDADRQARAAADAAEATHRREERRWLIGIVIAAGGLAVAIGQVIDLL